MNSVQHFDNREKNTATSIKNFRSDTYIIHEQLVSFRAKRKKYEVFQDAIYKLRLIIESISNVCGYK